MIKLKCGKCQRTKAKTHFSINKCFSRGYSYTCKKCKRQMDKIYRDKHKLKLRKWRKTYYQRYCLKNPWARFLLHIRNRCNNPKSLSYHNYGGKGIKNFLIPADLKQLWFRDKAYRLQKPSIDRLDTAKNYTKDNCRFIEWKDNIRPCGPRGPYRKG